jgi:hypothetical protein
MAWSLLRSWLRGQGGQKSGRGRRPARLGIEALEDRLTPSTFLVNNLSNDPTTANSLPWAVAQANRTAGADTIVFNYDSSQGTNFYDGTLHTITLAGQLDLSDTTGATTITGPRAGALTVSGNDATRVFQIDQGVTADISGLTIANGNSASSPYGGGIFNNRGTLTVTSCTFSGNSASSGFGGGIFNNRGTLTVTSSTFSGNSTSRRGGGIYNNDGTLTVTNSTFSGNSASRGGGGIFNNGSTLTVTNSTFSGNSASFGGGGITNNVGTLTLNNSIVANSTSGGDVHTYSGTVSGSHNLIGDGSGGLTGTITGDPLLGPLADNGGPTQTMALLPGSPALDAGDSSLAVDAQGASLTADQRGAPRVSNGAVDIGAFESRGFSMTITGGNNQRAIVNTAFATPLSVQVSSRYGEPVQGGVVTFRAPDSGAGATFSTPPLLSAAGQTSVSVTANGAAGSYTVSAVANGAPTQSFGLTNLPAIALSPATLPDGTYATAYGQTLAATGGAGGPFTFAVTGGTLPAGLSLDGTAGTLSGTPTAAGASIFTVTATDSAGFTASQSYTLRVDKAALTITANSTSKTYGQTLAFAGAEFTASGLVNGDTVSSVTLTSAGAAANASVVGSPYAIVANAAVGSGLDNYTISYVNGSLSVSPAALTVTADNQSTTYGGSLPTLTYHYTGLVNPDTSASLTGGLATTATPSSGVGSYPITQGSLAATGNYTIGAFQGGTLTVDRATPTVTWADPAAITYGTALSAAQLNATADVPGTFAYDPGLGAVLGAGTHLLSVTFTPDDTANYTSASASVQLTVDRATPTVTWADPAAITYGTALSAAQLDASADVPGTFAYSPDFGAVLGAGTHTLDVSFTPTDTANYTSASASVQLTVDKATPTLTWADPAAITYGTALSAAQLNATADVPGTFAYDLGLGAVLGAGTQTLSVTFTPADTANYNDVSAAAQLVVNKATLTVTVAYAWRFFGAAAPAFTARYSGFVNGETLATSGVTGSPGLSSTATAASLPGAYPIAASAGSLAAANYDFAYAPGTLTVRALPLLAVGAAAGAAPVVATYNLAGQRYLTQPFAAGFRGGVHVATGDLNGDGVADLVAAAGAGMSTVRVYPGRGGLPRSFVAFPGLAVGAFVAVGDVLGQGRPQIVVGAGPGARPLVRVYDGRTFRLLRGMEVFGSAYRGGVTVAAEGGVLICGTASGGGAVKVYDGAGLSRARVVTPFAGFSGGVNVAAAGGWLAVGRGRGAADVAVFDLAGLSPLPTIHTEATGPAPGRAGGVRVGWTVGADGAWELLSGSGPGWDAEVQLWLPGPWSRTGGFQEFGGFTGGVWVG